MLQADGLFPVGGYPGNDDDGRTLQAGLDQAKLRTDMLNSARHLKAHASSTGRLGVTGFCWSGISFLSRWEHDANAQRKNGLLMRSAVQAMGEIHFVRLRMYRSVSMEPYGELRPPA